MIIIRSNRTILILNFIIYFYYNLPDEVHARENSVADIYFNYYNGKSIKDVIRTPLTNFMKIVRDKNFKKHNRTLIYIHGYEETIKGISITSVVQAYLNSKTNTNIIVLDWTNMSDKSYITNAARNSELVGRAVAHYILQAIGNAIAKQSLHIVAHSLGCHVAASIGHTMQVYGVTLPRITGLDCAFPAFYPTLVGLRLTKEHATFVDSIHTDSGNTGMPISFGHVDFWPNGGIRRQPGCPIIDVFRSISAKILFGEACSHFRAWEYYIESVKSPKTFLAMRCSDYESFQKNRCNEKKTGYMGYGATNSLRGNYYLTTNEKSPFGRGKDGIKGMK